MNALGCETPRILQFIKEHIEDEEGDALQVTVLGLSSCPIIQKID